MAVANGRITAVIAASCATGVALTLGARAAPAAGHTSQVAPGGAAACSVLAPWRPARVALSKSFTRNGR